MKYRNPAKVISPKDYVSNVRCIHDGGDESFSIALINWEGDERFAMRWNVGRREWDVPEKKSGKTECVGMPSSHGYPVWFVLPDEIFDFNSSFWKALNNHNK